jgi:hypothetical protein
VVSIEFQGIEELNSLEVGITCLLGIGAGSRKLIGSQGLSGGSGDGQDYMAKRQID